MFSEKRFVYREAPLGISEVEELQMGGQKERDQLYDEIVSGIMQEAKDDPNDFFSTFTIEKYKGVKGIGKILGDVVKSDPIKFVSNFDYDRFGKVSGIEVIIEGAMKEVFLNHPGSFVYYLEKYKGVKGIDKILGNVVMVNESSVLSFFDNFRDFSDVNGIDKVVRKVAMVNESYVKIFFDRFYKVKGVKDIDEIVRDVAKAFPVEFLDSFPCEVDNASLFFKGYSEIFSYDSDYKKFGEWVFILIEYSPNDLSVYFELYKSQLWMNNGLKKYILLTLGEEADDVEVSSKYLEDFIANMKSKIKLVKNFAYHGTREESSSILLDPSLRYILDVEKVGKKIVQDLMYRDLVYEEMNFEAEFNNAIALVARNLFFQKKVVTSKTVQSEVLRIIEQRERYGKFYFFKGRNVLLAAHGERWNLTGLERDRFGKDGLVSRIEQDGGKCELVKSGKEDEDSLKDVRDETLERIITTPPPFTFVFDGHGSEDSLYFYRGQVEGSKVKDADGFGKITVDDLFETYRLRQINFPTDSSDIESRDVFITAACFSATFLRSFYEKCDEFNIQKPIFVSSVEYGREGMSKESDLGTDFFYTLFDGPNGHASMRNVFINDSVQVYSNPSVFVPDDDGNTMQLD